MTYEVMEKEINDIPKFGAKASLSNLKAYLEILNHPERKLRVIHVAGTNGKGSVCAFLESILREAGYKTGLFTSPHLVEMRERIRINDELCEKDDMVRAWKKIKDLMKQKKDRNLEPLTFFEVLFLMSLLIFEKESPDYCIMETGLGGRLDATVLTDPILCVITSISLDHVAILGDTIEKIAAEKAGIIKQKVPVVVLDENNGAFSVIKTKADQNMAPIFRVSEDDITILKKYENYIDFSFNNRYYKNNRFTISSQAEYQTINSALAAIGIKTILPELDDAVIESGIQRMYFPGRMEEILPHIYIDGAHNPGAVSQICKSLKHSQYEWSLLFAVCDDKDFTQMIDMLSQIQWKKIFITRIEATRGAAVQKVKACFENSTKLTLSEYEDVRSAFKAASQYIDRKNEERLLCLGSLYLVGELKRLIGILESEEYLDDRF